MTAMSAQSASQTTSEPARTVLLPGSPATYANRAFLKGLGLCWDPEGHRWHGTASAESVRALREQLDLVVRCFGSLEAPEHPHHPTTVVTTPGARPIVSPAPTLALARLQSPRRVHDGSRSRFESRLAFGGADDHEDEPDVIATSARQFCIWDTTSGLPDDSREEDERRDARHLRDLRGRVKAARAVVSTTPGLGDQIANDWRKAARFYAKFGITEAMFRHGVPSAELVGPSG
jgi:hypothetical protein